MLGKRGLHTRDMIGESQYGSASGSVRVQPRTDVLVGDTAGYYCFRIPALIRLPSGGLALYAEGRHLDCSDEAPTDIVYKTSKDDETPLVEVRSADSKMQQNCVNAGMNSTCRPELVLNEK